MTSDEMFVEIGNELANLFGKLWLADQRSIRMTFRDALTQESTGGVIERNRLLRQFDQFAELIAERLSLATEIEFPDLSENDQSNVLEAFVQDFRQAATQDERLYIKQDNQLHRIVGRYNLMNSNRQWGERRKRYYQLLLEECTSYLDEARTALPSFRDRAIRELLKNDRIIIALLTELLQRMPMPSPRSHAPERGFELFYRRDVVRRLDRLELFGVTFDGPVRDYSLTVAYIALALAAQADNRAANATGGFESQLVGDAFKKHKKILLRGEAGSGKTTLISWLAVKSGQREFSEHLTYLNRTIPFVIQLRHYAGQRLPTPEQLVTDFAANAPVEKAADWVTTVLSEGRGLVLIDGIDELPASERDAVKAWLEDLADLYGESYFVVSSRPPAISHGWVSENRFVILDINPMSHEQVRDFVDNWHVAAAGELPDVQRSEVLGLGVRLTELILSKQTLSRLATNPLLCALMCALNRARRGQLPNDRLGLYRTAIEMLLERRDYERSIADALATDLRLDEKIAILADIAYWFTTTGLLDAPSARIIKQIELSLGDDRAKSRDTREIYQYLLLRSGLLREPAFDRVNFLHKTFQEFLTAEKIVADDSIEMLVERVLDDSYREVIVMAAGLGRTGEQTTLLRAIQDTADSQTPGDSRQVRAQLLALECLDVVSRQPRELTNRIFERSKDLLPINSLEQARMFGGVSEQFLSLIDINNLTAQQAAATIRAVSLIGGIDSLGLIKEIAQHDSPQVRSEVLLAWRFHEPYKYAREVLPTETEAVDGALKVTDPEVLIAALSVGLDAIDCEFTGVSVTTNFLSALGSATNIRNLDFNRCSNVRNLTWLSRNRSLTSVTVRDCADFSGIYGIGMATRLRSLTLQAPSKISPNIDEIAELKQCAALERLTLWQAAPRLLDEVAEALPLLRQLVLQDCALSSTNEITRRQERRNELEKIWFETCPQLDDLSELVRTFPRIREVALTECSRITSLEGLSELDNLSQVRLSGCPELSLASLEELSHSNRLVQVAITTDMISSLGIDSSIVDSSPHGVDLGANVVISLADGAGEPD